MDNLRNNTMNLRSRISDLTSCDQARKSKSRKVLRSIDLNGTRLSVPMPRQRPENRQGMVRRHYFESETYRATNETAAKSQTTLVQDYRIQETGIVRNGQEIMIGVSSIPVTPTVSGRVNREQRTLRERNVNTTPESLLANSTAFINANRALQGQRGLVMQLLERPRTFTVLRDPLPSSPHRNHASIIHLDSTTTPPRLSTIPTKPTRQVSEPESPPGYSMAMRSGNLPLSPSISRQPSFLSSSPLQEEMGNRENDYDIVRSEGWSLRSEEVIRRERRLRRMAFQARRRR